MCFQVDNVPLRGLLYNSQTFFFLTSRVWPILLKRGLILFKKGAHRRHRRPWTENVVTCQTPLQDLQTHGTLPSQYNDLLYVLQNLGSQESPMPSNSVCRSSKMILNKILKTCRLVYMEIWPLNSVLFISCKKNLFVWTRNCGGLQAEKVPQLIQLTGFHHRTLSFPISAISNS